MMTVASPGVSLCHFDQESPGKLAAQLSDALKVTVHRVSALPDGNDPCIVVMNKQDHREMAAIEQIRLKQPGRCLMLLMPRLSVPALRWALSHSVTQAYSYPLSALEATELKLQLNEHYHCPSVMQRHTHDKLRQVLDLIEHTFDRPLTLNQLATEVGISHSRLSHLFRKELGIKFSHYLICRRLEAAPALLHEEGLTVAAIAYRLSFSTPSHFCRAFKAHFGLTPSEYKQGAKSGQYSNSYRRYLECRQPQNLRHGIALASLA
ncbi:helix-turn-helix domain-containing protein [Ferrimonas sp. SCSIO 43195]|uniref:helix-turn-helix domain-containing protein n=1 Tax=Ferrimonas sp. SCSIO 43195 TaxID=2822844 RepID=UPI002075486F|nr:AraC family transcriptional regulator [Ferrimonas sp. SCSIO 43195]USD36502.1 helix-turn-helix transcriptional regulator [Ferrimonas sp. SCSIO 43195]